MQQMMKMNEVTAVLVCWLSFLSLMSHFNISTININGARDAGKRSLLYEMMNIKKVDVMFVQETHSDILNESDWKKEWGGECC